MWSKPWCVVALCLHLSLPAVAVAQDYLLEQQFSDPGGVAFGIRVAVDGATFVVADSTASFGGVTNAGRVSIYARQGSAWVFQQQVGGTQVRDFFGSSVAVAGDTLVVGANGDLSSRPGKVVVFVRNGSSWVQQAVLTVSSGSTQDRFGSAVAVHGNTIVASAPALSAAHVFERTGTVWTPAGVLSGGAGAREFDQNVGVAGSTLCVGAPGPDPLGNIATGTTRVYVRGASTWTLQQTLTGPGGSIDFGGACAVDGDTMVVGGAGENFSTGAAYVYTRSGTAWTLQQTLRASDAAQRRFFGVSVALRADELIVGASGNPGAAYVFLRSGSSWTQRQRILDSVANRGFGGSVDVDAATLAVGSYSSGGRAAATYSRTATPPPLVPGAPTSFSATVSGNTINLSWTPPTTGGAATGFSLLGRTAPFGPILATVPMGGGTSFSVVAPNGTFSLSALASNGSGPGPESNAVTVTVPQAAPPPSAPAGLSVTVAGNAATFSWAQPAGGGAPTGYLLAAGLSPGFTTPIASLPLAGSATTTAIGGIPPGTYYVRVYAQNSAGTSGASNEVVVAVAAPAPPAAPSLAPATVVGRTVTLAWTPGSGVVSGYLLEASLVSGGPPVVVAAMVAPTATFQGVPAGTYFIRVRATNPAGQSAPSNEVTVVVQ